jgi:hypothetical protein
MTSTETRNQKTSKNYSIGSKRAGKPAWADNKPSNKLHAQSRSAQNPNNNKVGANNSEGGPGAGFQSTGQDGNGSCDGTR